MAEMIQKVKDFWIRSYTSDTTAFYFETVASLCVLVSMTWIAITAQHPPMHLIYPVSRLKSDVDSFVSKILLIFNFFSSHFLIL